MCISPTHEPPENQKCSWFGLWFYGCGRGVYGFEGQHLWFSGVGVSVSFGGGGMVFGGGGVFMVWGEDVYGFGVAFILVGKVFLTLGAKHFRFHGGVYGFWAGAFVVLGRASMDLGGSVYGFCGGGGLWFSGRGGGGCGFLGGGGRGVLVLVCWREVVFSSLPLSGGGWGVGGAGVRWGVGGFPFSGSLGGFRF